MINPPFAPPLPNWLAADHAPSNVFAVGLVNSAGTVDLRGTALLLDKPGLLATASHVIGRGSDTICVVMPDIDSIHQYQTTLFTQVRYLKAELVAFDPIHDLAVLRVPEFAPYVNHGLTVTGTDHIGVGQDVVSFGYPHLDSGRKVLTRFDSKIGAKILLPASTVNVKNVVLNTLARPGQSGAPIFRANSNELVAVLSGAYQPPNTGLSIVIGGADLSAMSQTTHCVSAEYLKEMY